MEKLPKPERGFPFMGSRVSHKVVISVKNGRKIERLNVEIDVSGTFRTDDIPKYERDIKNKFSKIIKKEIVSVKIF